MKKTLLVSLCLVVSVALVASVAFARNVRGTQGYAGYAKRTETTRGASDLPLDVQQNRMNAAAVQDTFFLLSSSFDQGANCVMQGWTTADVTAQLGTYWHVDDFVGIGAAGHAGRLLVPLQGAQSMWCGARASSAIPFCGYATLPGYGNGWNQALCTTNCLTVGTGVDITYLASWDSEPSYDATSVEITTCTGGTSDENWVRVDGGTGVFDVATFDSLVVTQVPDSLHSGSIKVRFHFQSDTAWSDQDGLWNTDGAFVVDSLSVNDSNGNVLPVETFETQNVGDTFGNNWTACTPIGYGDFAALFPGVGVVDEDPCYDDLTCLWGFFNGSTYNYSCGGFPGQATVPYENSRGQYIQDEIWSPTIAWTGSGSQAEMSFLVYRDLALNPLIFYVWHVRSYINGCPTGWDDDNFVYYGAQKDWLRTTQAFGSKVVQGASDIQVALGVIDMCQYWCGVYGNGQCHSHAPLIDDFEVYRINAPGPQFNGRDIDQFQDTFASDGTLTGTARIDAAIDRMPSSNPTIYPGDSAVVDVTGPEVALSVDPNTGFGPAAYLYVALNPTGQASKTGSNMEKDNFRWPWVGSTTIGGVTWDIIRMDSVFTGARGSGLVPDKYCVDLNDSLFTPGDTISFFYGATDSAGNSNYWNAGYGQTADIATIAANADECTILPAGGHARGGDILYVDGMNFRGAQPYFDSSFDALHILDQVDRYDVRGPSSGVGNRPGARVSDVFQQLIPVYRKIIWNTGDLEITLGAGTAEVEKSDDWGMLNTWMDNLGTTGGVYLNGDDLAEIWSSQTGASAVNFRQFLHYNLVSGNYYSSPPTGQAPKNPAPLSIGETGGFFDHVTGPDTLVAYGGCALINDFDVLEPTGTAVPQMAYMGQYDPNNPNASVISQTTTNSAGFDVTAILSGFSFHYIRDDRPAGVLDRYHHMYDILNALGNTPEAPVPVPTTTYSNALIQNYPNPFNPQTTIKFTVKERTPVTLKIYNVAGQLVRTLVNDVRAPGVTYSVPWNGRNDAGQSVSSGVYFYKLVAKGFTDTKKMVLLK